jgi:hypothetical protein
MNPMVVTTFSLMMCFDLSDVLVGAADNKTILSVSFHAARVGSDVSYQTTGPLPAGYVVAYDIRNE